MFVDAKLPGSSDAYIVPAGKRLVLEFVAEMISVPSGQLVPFADINGFHFATASVGNDDGGLDNFIVNQVVHFYVGPGQPVRFLAGRNFNGVGEWYMDGKAVGRLLDCSGTC
jgi:hypothetical protein